MELYMIDQETLPFFSSLYPAAATAEIDNPDELIIGAVEEVNGETKPVGILAAELNGLSLGITYLYVEKDFRRKGIATGMLDQLMIAIGQTQLNEVYTIFSASTEGMSAFFSDFGFSVLYNEGWNKYRIPLGKLKTYNTKGVKGIDIEPLILASAEQLEEFSNNADKYDVPVFVPLPVNAMDYSAFSSCCMLNGHIVGIILAEEAEENGKTVISIPWFYVLPKVAPSIIQVYNAMVTAMQEYYPEDTMVVFETCTQKSDSILYKMIPNAELEEEYMATWLLG